MAVSSAVRPIAVVGFGNLTGSRPNAGIGTVVCSLLFIGLLFAIAFFGLLLASAVR